MEKDLENGLRMILHHLESAHRRSDARMLAWSVDLALLSYDSLRKKCAGYVIPRDMRDAIVEASIEAECHVERFFVEVDRLIVDGPDLVAALQALRAAVIDDARSLKSPDRLPSDRRGDLSDAMRIGRNTAHNLCLRERIEERAQERLRPTLAFFHLPRKGENAA